MKKSGAGKKVVAAIVLIVALAVFFGCSYIAFSAPFEGRSGSGKLFEVLIDVFMAGDGYVSPDKTDEKIERRRRLNEGWRVPASLKSAYGFTTELFENYEICRFNPGKEDVIYYFHGGSFMWQPLVFHYDFCRYISEELDAEVVMPIYPKAPTNDFNDVMEWLKAFYVSEGIVPTAFMGDSAGGAIAISFSQYLFDCGEEIPGDVAVISPVLDLSLENPEMEKSQRDDPMLNLPDLKRKLATYANGEYKNPYVSPIYCDFGNLGELTLITGTHELLLPDARKLNEMLTSAGITHNYCEFELFHTFPLFPIPERTQVVNIIREAIK